MKQHRREPSLSSADPKAVAIENFQRSVPVRIRPLQQFLTQMNRALGLPNGALAVRLINDREMTRLNHTYRAKKKTTDVLSFPLESRNSVLRRWKSAKLPPTKYLGDIVISPTVARQNAKRLNRSLDAELQILILHGTLHLLGYDHEVDNGEMERIELKLRHRLGIA